MYNITQRKTIIAYVMIATMLVAACGTFVKTSYQTLSSVATIVDTARGAYNEFYKAGKVTPELAKTVEKSYAVYQVSMNFAIQSVRAYQNLASKGSVVSPDSANKAIQDAQDCTNALLTAFSDAGVPKQEKVLIEKIKPVTK